jgi:hypothetical protein
MRRKRRRRSRSRRRWKRRRRSRSRRRRKRRRRRRRRKRRCHRRRGREALSLLRPRHEFLQLHTWKHYMKLGEAGGSRSHIRSCAHTMDSSFSAIASSAHYSPPPPPPPAPELGRERVTWRSQSCSSINSELLPAVDYFVKFLQAVCQFSALLLRVAHLPAMQVPRNLHIRLSVNFDGVHTCSTCGRRAKLLA